MERVLRGVGLAALAVMLVDAWRGAPAALPARTVAPGALAGVLATWPLGPETLTVVTDTALDGVTSAWLAARRDAGAPSRWGNRATPASAVALEPTLDPGGGVRALVAAPRGAVVQLGDSVGAIDSATVHRGGVVFTVASPVGRATARVNGSPARSHPPAVARPRAVIVLARAGWEAKFVTAALEERGWPVEVRLVVRPDTSVVQGSPARLDTSRVAVVVALDASAAPQAAALGAFVRSGGGLVLGPDAAMNAAFANLRAGATGPRQAPLSIAVAARDPRRALPLVPIVTLEPGAVALERRDATIAVAARRVSAGRVVQVGYDDSWRWRMTGPDGAREAHRRWWAALVASASPERLAQATFGGPAAVSTADAPLARMVADLGAPDPTLLSRSGGASPDPGPLGWWWGVLALAALLAEWASRRLRGVP